MTHEIKILCQFADAIVSGDKTFEIRENDRAYQKGDFIKFKPIDKNGFRINGHPIADKEYVITYVINGWGLKNGFVTFGIKDKNNDNEHILNSTLRFVQSMHNKGLGKKKSLEFIEKFIKYRMEE